jgi:hypothetical protein
LGIRRNHRVLTAPLFEPESALAEALDNAFPAAREAFAASNQGVTNVPVTGRDRRHRQSPLLDDGLKELREPDADLNTA